MLAKIVFFSFGKLQFNSSTNFCRWVFICPACVCVWEPTTMTFKKKSFWQQWYKSTFINSITLFIYLLIFAESGDFGIDTSRHSDNIIGWTLALSIDTLLWPWSHQSAIAIMSKIHTDIDNVILLCRNRTG